MGQPIIDDNNFRIIFIQKFIQIRPLIQRNQQMNMTFLQQNGRKTFVYYFLRKLTPALAWYWLDTGSSKKKD